MLSFELTWDFEVILSNTWWKAFKDSVGSMHELCFLICSESLSHWLNLALPQNNHKQPWIIFATWDSRGCLVIMAFCLVFCFFLGPARKKKTMKQPQQKMHQKHHWENDLWKSPSNLVVDLWSSNFFRISPISPLSSCGNSDTSSNISGASGGAEKIAWMYY